MKRYPVIASLIIAMVRGYLLNYGVYYATRAALGLTFEWRHGLLERANYTKEAISEFYRFILSLLYAEYILSISSSEPVILTSRRVHLVDPENNTPDMKPNVSDSQTEQPNNATETPIQDSGLVSVSSTDSRKVSREDIELVQNLIERCLQFYMNRDEVVKTLLNRARIDPRFTTLVWQKLEEENADFFRT
ncbi:hypothetical protein OROMI_028448 [Orobanche minor]